MSLNFTVPTSRARKLSEGQQKGNTVGFFTAVMHTEKGDINFSDLQLVRSTKVPGAYYVSCPQSKGRDGKWYYNYTLSEGIREQLVPEAMAKLQVAVSHAAQAVQHAEQEVASAPAPEQAVGDPLPDTPPASSKKAPKKK